MGTVTHEFRVVKVANGWTLHRGPSVFVARDADELRELTVKLGSPPEGEPLGLELAAAGVIDALNAMRKPRGYGARELVASIDVLATAIEARA